MKITADTPDTINVKLITDTRKLDEVVISAKRRHKYSRKNNPAVELMKRVIAAKERSNLENHDYYQYNKYQKVTMGINNLTPEDLENKKFKDSRGCSIRLKCAHSTINSSFLSPSTRR